MQALAPLDEVSAAEPAETVLAPDAGGWSPATLAPLLLAAICLAVVAAVAWAAAVRVPFSDPHDWDALVFATERTGDWLAYLWKPHTEQRIVFVRILAWLDIDVVRGRVPVYLLSTLAVLAAEAAGLAFAMARGLRFSKLGWALAGVVAALALNVAAAEDCALPVFSVYIFVAGFAALGIALFDAGGRSWAALSLALLCGVMAGFGNEAGLAIWPVLMLSGGREPQDRERQLAVWLVGLIYMAACLIGLGAPSQSFHASRLADPGHALKMALYFAGFCGLPWSAGGGASSYPGRLLGICFAGYGLWLAWRGPREQGRLRGLERMGVDLVLFGLATAVLATVGRVDENAAPNVATRYFPFAALLQAGLVFASAPALARAWTGRRAALGAVLIAFSVLMVVQEPLSSRTLRSWAPRIRAASRAFDAGDRSPQVLLLVHPNPELAADVRAELKRRGLPY